MINLPINKEVIQLLRSKGFFPDTLVTKYLILHCLFYTQEEFLDELDDFSSSKRFMLQYIELQKDGWIEENGGQYIFSLTEKGNEMMKNLKMLTTPAEVKKANEVDEWIDEWVELFPSGVKTGGKLLRSDRKSSLMKMKKFVRDYPYSKDLIFKATKSYLLDRERAGWQYTRASVYFIDKKGEGSDLAAWCDKIKEKTAETFSTYNSGLI